jgi:hypothetical protein
VLESDQAGGEAGAVRGDADGGEGAAVGKQDAVGDGQVGGDAVLRPENW